MVDADLAGALVSGAPRPQDPVGGVKRSATRMGAGVDLPATTGSCHVRGVGCRAPSGFARRAVRWYGPCVRALLAVVVLVIAALALEVLITLVAKT